MPCCLPSCACGELGFVSLQRADGLTITYCKPCWHTMVRTGLDATLEHLEPVACTYVGAGAIRAQRARYVAFCLAHAIYPPPLEAS